MIVWYYYNCINNDHRSGTTSLSFPFADVALRDRDH